MDELITFGISMKRRRKQLGLSQNALAKKMGVSHSYVWNVEHDRCNITYDKMEEFAAHLDAEIHISLKPISSK
jgi:transcriptional regulator with XRE-family HTH domain